MCVSLPPKHFSYCVKIINPARKKESSVCDLWKFTGKFLSFVEVKMRLIEEFKEQVPSTLNSSVGYFEGRQSSKKWLVSPEDMNAMYCTFELEKVKYVFGVKEFEGKVKQLHLESIKGLLKFVLLHRNVQKRN